MPYYSRRSLKNQYASLSGRGHDIDKQLSALLREIASQAVRTLHDLDKRLLAALTPLGSAPDVPDSYGQQAYSLRTRKSTAATVLECATPEHRMGGLTTHVRTLSAVLHEALDAGGM